MRDCRHGDNGRQHLRRQRGEHVIDELIVDAIATQVLDPVDEVFDVRFVARNPRQQKHQDRPAAGQPHDALQQLRCEVGAVEGGRGFRRFEAQIVRRQRQNLVRRQVVGKAQRKLRARTDEENAFGRPSRQQISEERQNRGLAGYGIRVLEHE